ncbi:MAG: hypothetical protein JXR34_06815 [Bacteroidales bacterium]|nr:hypothetical protein [Bacteroidales bacterium]
MTCNIWDKYQENNRIADNENYPVYIQKHLLDCEDCRRKEVIDRKLNNYSQSVKDFQTDSFFTERVMAKIAENQVVKLGRPNRFLLRYAAAIAILVTSVSLGILAGRFSAGYYHQNTSQTYSELAQALQFGGEDLSFDLVVLNEE